MINRVELTRKEARELLFKLCEKFPWRFTFITKEDISMRVNLYDDVGLEYNVWVAVHANKDNRSVSIYVNKKEFPPFARSYDLDLIVVDMFKGYVEQLDKSLLDYP
ncbi:MAG: hypothetical protein DRJ03_08080 [Chloroflexi bacterium]|nr:MAG: hypothetical protein DRJ03_08080 [Chloroflexota bacterium]